MTWHSGDGDHGRASDQADAPSKRLVKPTLDTELGRTRAQLAVYARDLRRMVVAEREKRKVLDATHKQLQVYARDVKRGFEAERRKTRELEKSFRDTVWRLTRAAQYKDNETGAHIRRLSRYAAVVARQLGVPEPEAERIAAAAPMHDIGKLAVPDAILHKKGPLDGREWEIMKRHSGFGASLLQGSASPLLEIARQIALTHHERCDGTGYPQGLKGEEIPLCGRIVMLIDQYDALRSMRCYKPPFDHERTRRILLEGDGRTMPSHFDPTLLDAFCAVHKELEAVYAEISD
jgi:putative two-component system response regulator